jgi:hypothetical protein
MSYILLLVLVAAAGVGAGILIARNNKRVL